MKSLVWNSKFWGEIGGVTSKQEKKRAADVFSGERPSSGILGVDYFQRRFTSLRVNRSPNAPNARPNTAVTGR